MLTTRGVGVGFAALILAGSLSVAGCGGESHPNVLLISVDMLRADHVSCFGYAKPTSPNMDALAKEGVAFEKNFASSSWTLPSHAAIFTSLPDSLHGCTDTDRSLDPSAVTLAERFQAQGYETAGFFSGAYLHPAFGLGQGFERYVDCTGYASMTTGKPTPEWAMDKDVMQASHHDVTGERTFAAFQGWLGQHSKKPFFAFVHLWDVHFDFTPPPPYDTKFDPGYTGPVDGKDFFFDNERYKPGMDPKDFQHLLALYDGEIAWTDSIIGRIRAELEKKGLLENTVIALTSDHGTEFFEHGKKGHRMTLYDEVLRTPLVLRYPKTVPQGRRVTELSRGIDLGPTLLEIAGFPVPQDVYGQSLLSTFAAPSTAPSPTGAAGGAARTAPRVVGRAVSELESVGQHLRAVRTQRWKLIDHIGTEEHVYFDLQQDAGEQRPLTDFDSDLGKKAVTGYEDEVATLNAFAGTHPVPAARGAVPSQPPEEVLRRLKELGYVGDENRPATPGGSPSPEPPPQPPKK
jgi:arylsulfatase A-like enzyme